MVFPIPKNQARPTSPSTINGINRLPDADKRSVFSRLIPDELLTYFQVPADLRDGQGRDLLRLDCSPGCSDAEMYLFHQVGFRDPVLYGHITDTISGQIHILLYVINDPEGERFDIDHTPDGAPTLLGTAGRNRAEELRAMQAGLSPGQIRRGLRLMSAASHKFEEFVKSLGHPIYFAEPLYYHNAILFERLGFAYQSGRSLMEKIQAGFSPGGELAQKLDGSPFRSPSALNSIRLRSWAIHDGILGQPFTGVTMYKQVGKYAGISTSKDSQW
jgi:hypothetical protein